MSEKIASVDINSSSSKTERNQITAAALSISRGEMMNVHMEIARYYSNFGFLESSDPDDMFDRVFRPSVQ